MLHEYGHAVMTALYGYNFHNLPYDSFQGGHSVYTVSDPGFAMKEGWAEFFEALVDDSAYNVTAYANSDTPNIESNDWWTGDIDGKGSNARGEMVEVRGLDLRPVAPDVGEAHVVGHDEDDVGSRPRVRGGGGAACRPQRERRRGHASGSGHAHGSAPLATRAVYPLHRPGADAAPWRSRPSRTSSGSSSDVV